MQSSECAGRPAGLGVVGDSIPSSQLQTGGVTSPPLRPAAWKWTGGTSSKWRGDLPWSWGLR